jgi:hypothetical protein
MARYISDLLSGRGGHRLFSLSEYISLTFWLSAEYAIYSPDNNGLAAYHSDLRLYSKRNVGYGTPPPMLELTITSPHLIVNSEAQLSNPTTANA